jgi:hypothetical protein
MSSERRKEHVLTRTYQAAAGILSNWDGRESTSTNISSESSHVPLSAKYLQGALVSVREGREGGTYMSVLNTIRVISTKNAKARRASFDRLKERNMTSIVLHHITSVS